VIGQNSFVAFFPQAPPCGFPVRQVAPKQTFAVSRRFNGWRWQNEVLSCGHSGRWWHLA